MSNLDDVFLSPNGGAYEKRETRIGPPLAYVGEKLAASIRALHEDLAGRAPKERSLMLRSSLQWGVTAFLALHNMLALTHTRDWFTRIEDMTPEQFRMWTERIESSGLVNW